LPYARPASAGERSYEAVPFEGDVLVPFTLPDHVAVTPDSLRAIAERHRLPSEPIIQLPETGIFNAVYRIGDRAILRVPRNDPNFIAAIYTESVAVPAARQAGVCTPALLAFDTALVLLPVPYTLYELVPGVTLESCDLDPGESFQVWRELGRDLALAHAEVPVAGNIAQLPARSLGDPRPLLDQRIEQGWLSRLDGRWLGRWLDRLALMALAPASVHFLHGDVQAANLMVQPDPLNYRAIIDWGSASVGDVACDFAAVPLRAAPYLLGGYRETIPPDVDDTIEARIVWRHLELALKTLPRGAVPGRSWAERPLPILLEVMRFFADPPSERWRSVGPTPPGSR
jgi:aminoglycoside phosphotransferase (APT) family kinase protein